MSATRVCLLILALSHTTLGGKGRERLLRLKEGKSVTINCRTTGLPQQQSLSLQTGLDKEVKRVFNFDFETNKEVYQDNIKGRLQRKLQRAQNLDITITNLTIEDTGVYWCVYSRFNLDTNELENTDGSESVLLVVDVAEQCGGGDAGEGQASPSGVPVTLVMVSSLFAGGVLLLAVIGLLFRLIPKIKARRTKMRVAPQTGPHQVYEDMRATVRRQK